MTTSEHAVILIVEDEALVRYRQLACLKMLVSGRMPFASREQARQGIANMPEGSIHTVALLDAHLVGTVGIIASKGRRNHVGAIWLDALRQVGLD